MTKYSYCFPDCGYYCDSGKDCLCPGCQEWWNNQATKDAMEEEAEKMSNHIEGSDVCQVTKRPFVQVESQEGERDIVVQCSECSEILEWYEV